MNAAPDVKTNLLGLDRTALADFVAALGEKPFRARQLMTWLYKRRVGDFAAMTDLAKSFRERLAAVAEVRLPEIISEHSSSDGTRKWLLRAGTALGPTGTDQAIEMVFIPEPGRGTLCISSQVGCALDCSFCSTGAQGFNRNLTTAEIVGQVWLANQLLGVAEDGARAVTNVVLMGMGEPLANYRNVLPALSLFMDDLAFDLSRRRVTLSTSGLVPQIYKLAEDTNVALAVSLHAPNDALRDELVPINRKHPISELLKACWHYLDAQNGRSISFEYVMLEGVNDKPEHAIELAALLRGHDAKVNLIPFNPWPGVPYDCSTAADIRRFSDFLQDNNYSAPIRASRGSDILAACGQLRSESQRQKCSRLAERQALGIEDEHSAIS